MVIYIYYDTIISNKCVQIFKINREISSFVKPLHSFIQSLVSIISFNVRDLWQSALDTAVNNKLHATKPLIGERPSAYRSVRRDGSGFI